jgi:hypothetical protein
MTYGLSTLIWIVQIAAGIYCILDVQKHSEEAFQAAGTPKQTALILTIVGLVCCWPVLLYYWFGIKPKVDAAEGAGGYGGGGYPPAG